MNRRISTNLEAIDAEALPPARRAGAIRMLFVHGNILGFRNVAAQLKRFTADRPDVDAVHVDLVTPTWMKVLGKSIPGLHGWDLHQDRHLRMWGRVMERWFRGPLDLARFDVVHVMTQVHAWAALRHRRRHRVGPGGRPRFAVNVDSTAAIAVRDFGHAPASRALFRRAEARLFAVCDLIVCRNAWCAASPGPDYGVPADRVHVAANSIDPPSRRRDWSGPGDPAEPPRLAFVGSGWHRKGGDLVLEAWRRAGAPGRLDVYGFEASVARGAVPAGVRFHGRVPREHLRDAALPTADAFVLASRFDMLPWAILEAAAAGLPMIAPRVGAIADVVRPGETGHLFEPGDVEGLAAAIARLMGDADERARLGRAAAALVDETFRADRTYPALVDRLVALADEEVVP